MRKAWVMNVFREASIETSGWTVMDLEKFIADLKYTSTIMKDDEKRPGFKVGTSFISTDELERAIAVTEVRKYVRSLDSRRRSDK